jgi:hypothetical protein
MTVTRCGACVAGGIERELAIFERLVPFAPIAVKNVELVPA